MIEVNNIQPVNKGSLLAICDVRIVPWKLTLKEVKIFQKGASTFLSLPTRDFLNDAGEKKYIELMEFDNDTIKNKFKNQILVFVNKYLEENPNLEVEDVIKEDDSIPF